VQDVLLDSRAISRGYFRRDALERLIRANSDSSDYSKEIFSLLSLELWQRAFLEGERVVF
jgi:asparagine synthase (glutamine-hydrolysing)